MNVVDPAQQLNPIPALATAPLPTLGNARRLMLLLATGHPAFIPKLKSAFAGRMGLAQVWAEVEPAAIIALREAATALAEAVGAEMSAVLQFSRLDEERAEFRGRHGILRRFDRVWGGPTLAGLEATTEVRYAAPPCHYARWLVTKGPVWLQAPQPRPPDALARVRLGAHAGFQLAAGEAFVLPHGAAVLVRRPPVDTLLEAVRVAGLSVDRVLSAVEGSFTVPIPTPVGALSLDAPKRRARLNQREVRLSQSECTALEALCNPAGVILDRAVLAARLGLSQSRNVDHIIVQLRNKLGDGLITTVYGAGYLLETLQTMETPGTMEGRGAALAITPDSTPS